jgi:GAF domain-containing protein
MELRLVGEGRRVMLDSRIEGFDRIARQAAVAAERQRLALNPTTTTNFAALGIRLAPGAGE